MRIATWNINGLRARFDFLLHWLRARSPDVVGLQELKLSDEQFPHAELEAAGYRALVHGQRAWNGVAILARLPLEPLVAGLPGQEEMGARLVSARVGEMVFTSIYCPNGKHLGHEDFPRKLAWLDALSAHLQARHRAGEPLALVGDFNLCPTPLDSWNEPALAGEIFHTPEERERFALLARWGLIDLFRAHHPERRAFSWWDYRGGAFHKGEGLRIDLLLATAPLAERVKAVEIDRDYRKKQAGLVASDHAPVWADLA
jgi:exodeoxyribonuclease-3